MRRIRQPGPAQPERALVVPCHATPVEAVLPAGVTLLAALHDLVAMHGADSACLSLAGGALGPFGYVMPALSPDASHAAWYSAPRHPPGVTRWDHGCVTVGLRDGATFFHCHGIWTEADGKRSGGHVLPEATTIAAPIRTVGGVIHGARFAVVHDPETNFRLFEPAPTGSLPPWAGGSGSGDGAGHEAPPPAAAALAIRLRPNQDITLALEAAARAAGFAQARVVGGVGSIIGARFADGRVVEPFATEMFLFPATIRPGLADGLAVGLVDLAGEVARGTLLPADNPILMTLEVLLAAG